jgi:hypothetical protein
MVADSKISFDVINFDTLNWYSVIGFVVLGCIAIGYFFVTQIVIYLLQPLLPKNIMVLILILTILGTGGLEFPCKYAGPHFRAIPADLVIGLPAAA